MRLLDKRIDKKTGEGTVRLKPEESDDIYHLFNFITPGDQITTVTTRNV